MSMRNLRFLVPVAISLIATGCIADTKLPPEATVEYLPCSAMDLSDNRTDPSSVLAPSPLWGGFWTIGDGWHIGLTDPGEIDWDDLCGEINDPALVVHDVPHPLDDLNGWNNQIADQISGPMSVELTVISGQYVLEIRAENLARAADVTRGVPVTAWAYGGRTSISP